MFAAYSIEEALRVKSKRALMGLAALLILFFHFYPMLFNTGVERFLRQSAYIGVDLFFFLSAASLGRKQEISFKSFALNRLQKVYLPFAVFCIVAAVYKKWAVKKIIFTLTGVELVTRGGGSFLWFLPGIMIFYLCVPVLVKLKKRFGLWSLFGGLLFWAALVAVLQYGFKYTTLFILLNRLPIFLIGLYTDVLREKPIKLYIRIPVTILLFALGQFLLYKYGRLNVPFRDMYYIVAIPAVLSVTELFELLYGIRNFKLRILEIIGGNTLEIYSLQMIFGYDIMSFILKETKNKALSFILTLVLVILLSILINAIKRSTVKLVSKIGGKKE